MCVYSVTLLFAPTILSEIVFKFRKKNSFKNIEFVTLLFFHILRNFDHFFHPKTFPKLLVSHRISISLNFIGNHLPQDVPSSTTLSAAFYTSPFYFHESRLLSHPKVTFKTGLSLSASPFLISPSQTSNFTSIGAWERFLSSALPF